MTLKELMALARQCLEIIENHDDDIEEGARDALNAGEPEYAIADALSLAYEFPELFSQFPDEVYELAKNPDYTPIHRYLDLLEKYREN
ncbi:hypothetical protein KIH77_05310 [Bifidobacterium sp. 82T24]|uniref:hypothetical protein n=1 Tax=Bifidobacterium pluvialisilvae TaxID=2834436 RepID=UPI001C566B09|nr:hypothetical protein [Bifidobacterium pluvialisilvae]MBW3088147.1 hypothetical protein [Bifidobacterium pluvialisilvae]